MKWSVVTPCYNSEQYIEETVQSVLQQSAVLAGDVELEYIIRDGGSTDSTRAILSKYEQDGVSIVSQPDNGMYDALSSGLQQCTGDVVSYINAGDYYHTSAIRVVQQVFEKHEVQWLTGFNTFCNEDSAIVSVNLPYRYRPALLRKGAYGLHLPFVQQESTFWSRTLHSCLDFDALRSYRLAGDHYLWTRFATMVPLKLVQAQFGVFKNHAGQLSTHIEKYRTEAMQNSLPLNISERVQVLADSALWYAPNVVKRRANPGGIIHFDMSAQRWV